jgi:leucyl aminopeptidase (aminopeptidase T)
MDIHTVDGGLSAADVAEAHKVDLALQAKHGVEYRRYWVDEEAGKIFCLVDAPSAEAAAAVHMEAHGRTADQIFEVTEGA